MGAIYFQPSVLSCYFIYENLFILCYGGADENHSASVFLLPFDGVVGCRSHDTASHNGVGRVLERYHYRLMSRRREAVSKKNAFSPCFSMLFFISFR